MNKNKELLFSITKKDFIIEPYKGRGNGGQKRNKTMSCVRIRQPESGAEAIGTEHREQKRNRDAAFNRLIKTKKFKAWYGRKIAELSMDKIEIEKQIDRAVDKAMRSENIKIEYGQFKEKK